MAKSKKRKASRRRGSLCTGDNRLAKFNPKTGNRFKRPMCVSPSGKTTVPRKAPSARSILKKTAKLDCRKKYELGTANPMTGKKYARPTCVLVLKSGKVRTHAPTRGKKSRASAVKVARVIAVSGRR